MAIPLQMIACEWNNCPSLFSTGVDMNQHVLLNHIKYLKVHFDDTKCAKVVSNDDEKREQEEVRRKTPEIQVMTTVAKQDSQKIPCLWENCSATFDSKQEVRHHYHKEHIAVNPVAPNRRRIPDQSKNKENPPLKKHKSDEKSSSELKMNGTQKPVLQVASSGNVVSPKMAPLQFAPVLDASVKPVLSPSQSETHEAPIETIVLLEFSSRSKMSENCQIVLGYLHSLPVSRFQKKDDQSQFCFMCMSFKKCEIEHDFEAKRLAKTWKQYYGNLEVSKEGLIEQLERLKKKYLKVEEKDAKGEK